MSKKFLKPWYVLVSRAQSSLGVVKNLKPHSDGRTDRRTLFYFELWNNLCKLETVKLYFRCHIPAPVIKCIYFLYFLINFFFVINCWLLFTCFSFDDRFSVKILPKTKASKIFFLTKHATSNYRASTAIMPLKTKLSQMIELSFRTVPLLMYQKSTIYDTEANLVRK